MNSKQRSNCATLATYLEKLPLNYSYFGMASFLSSDDANEEELAEYARHNGGVDQFPCGTAACAVGHGPAAGILFDPSEIDYGTPDWDKYSQRFADTETPEWQWMFSGLWSDRDDSHRGAAARIRYLLDGNTIPEKPDGYPYYMPHFSHVELYAQYKLENI